MKTDFACGLIPFRVRAGVREWLLIQHQAGHWAFPKGHPEADETDLQAAVREVREETGLQAGRDVRVLEDLGMLEEGYVIEKKSGKQIDKTVRYWLAEQISDAAVVVQEEELLAFEWLPLAGRAGAHDL